MAEDDFFCYNGQRFKTGDQVTCVILDTPINDAKIYVLSDLEKDTSNGRTGYICQNLKNGNRSPNNLGYKRSWSFTYVFGGLSDHVINLKKINTDLYEDILDQAFPHIRN